jgi:hypothetical protein
VKFADGTRLRAWLSIYYRFISAKLY